MSGNNIQKKNTRTQNTRNRKRNLQINKTEKRINK